MAVVEVSNAHSLLAGDMGRFYADPLRYVMYAYPWGEGELAGFSGPRDWQAALLRQIGEEVREREFDGIHPVAPIQIATASGHGIGKSALTAWIVQWIMDTRPFAKGVVTANTSDQLRTKTGGSATAGSSSAVHPLPGRRPTPIRRNLDRFPGDRR